MSGPELESPLRVEGDGGARPPDAQRPDRFARQASRALRARRHPEEAPMSGEADQPGTSEHPQPAPRVRASDADRHVVVHRLQEAVARGLLTFDEGSERMARAWDSRHLDELPALTADLPATALPAPTAPGWRALGLLALLQLRTTLG